MTTKINGTTGITTPKLDALDLELGSKNVVERGGNANGEYVRFADGTQICTGFIEAVNNGTGSSGSKIFSVAAEFIGSNFVIGYCTDNATSSNYVVVCNPQSTGSYRAFLRGDDGTGRMVAVPPPTVGYFLLQQLVAGINVATPHNAK